MDFAKQSAKENAATHTRFEELPRKQISDYLGNGSRAVSSSDDADSDPRHLEPHDGPRLKSMKRHMSNDRRERDHGTVTATKHVLNLSSGTASKQEATNGDSKAEQKRKLSKKRDMLEESQGTLDED